MLTADELCDICHVTPTQRRDWAKGGDLRQRRSFEELDALELATYARMREAVGPRRAKRAWRDLRKQLQPHFLDPPRRLWAVIETTGVSRHGIAESTTEVASMVEHGRPVVVLGLRALMAGARAEYREVANRKGSVSAGRTAGLRRDG